MFYAMAYLLQNSSGELAKHRERTPEPKAFQRRMWAGDVNLTDNAAKSVYGWFHWEQLVRNMRQARYGEALRIVSDRHARG